MDIQWRISAEDVERLTSFITKQSKNALVIARRKRNLAKIKPDVTRSRFWRAMVSMRLTSVQKSGPDSFVARFIRAKPFPLTYKTVSGSRHPESLISKALKAAGGIRFSDKIAHELSVNFSLLETDKWATTLELCNRLTRPVSREVEIEVADQIQSHFLGFGPKQSRNLLQALGLTRYEIPIDSRLTDWLNEFGFPIRLSAKALADNNYYRVISDGIQTLCEHSCVLPCIFDAAVFASRDSVGWTDENVIF
jgi:N-glycosylase/DNA lyase